MLKKFLCFILLCILYICGFGFCTTINNSSNIDFEKEMVNWVEKINDYAKEQNSNFGIFPQNGSDLIEYSKYIEVITGVGQEDLYYGYDGDGVETPYNVTSEIEENLDIMIENNKLVLVTNYTFDNENTPSYDVETQAKVDDAYSKSLTKTYVPFCTVRNLNYFIENPNHLPTENTPPIDNWNNVKEFLYILQTPDGMSRTDFLNNIGESKYDLIIMDYSFDGTDEEKFSEIEISALKSQLNGLLIAYLSIGEAENYRYYWNSDWDSNNDGIPDDNAPDWLGIENPDWEGNYKVHYWNEGWQNIILAYLDKIIDAGFDGVYLDIIDAYEYYE